MKTSKPILSALCALTILSPLGMLPVARANADTIGSWDGVRLFLSELAVRRDQIHQPVAGAVRPGLRPRWPVPSAT